MKANGKNLMMFSYQVQEYMDLKPSTSFRTIESREKMDEFVNYMKTAPWSGTIFDVKEVSPMDFFKARQSRYWRGYEEQLDNLALDCPSHWVAEYEFYINHKDYDEATLLRMYDDYIEDMISNYISK